MNLANAKSDLRAKIRAALARVSPAVRAVESLDLCGRLKLQMRSARAVLFFAPLLDEPDVWPLLEEFVAAGKIAALPFFDAEKKTYGARQVSHPAAIHPGKFGVREPAASCAEILLNRFDLVLVPGTAFDLQGHRLGRGLGFYDRLLENTSGIKCGVCLDLQVVEKIPIEPHDAKVDFIFTPSRCVKAGKDFSQN